MRVIWTDEATRRFEFILTCSRDFYSKKTLRTLNEELKRNEHFLQENPRMGQVEPFTRGRSYEYRHIVLSPPFKLLYFLCQDDVYIADIWDTRQDPVALAERLP